MKRWGLIVILGICLSLIVGTVNAQNDPPPPEPNPEVEQLQAEVDSLRQELAIAVAEAEDANSRADSILNTIDVMIAFIGGIGVLVTIVGAITAVIGLNRAREEGKQLQAQLDEARQSQATFDNTVAKVNDMKVEIEDSTKTLDDLRQDIQDEMNSQINRINNALSRSQFAQLQIGLGNMDAALDALKEACELDPDNRVNQYFLGDVYVRQGDIETGMAHLSKARSQPYTLLSADASYAYAMRRMGDSTDNRREQEKCYTKALDIFLELHDLAPNLLDVSGESVFGAVAGIYNKKEQYDEAIVWYRHVNSVTPHNSYPLNNLGLLHWAMGRYDEARHYFRESHENALQKIRITPSDYWAWFDYITAEVALEKDRAQIQADLQRVFKLKSGADPLQKFHRGLERLKTDNPPANLREILNLVQTELNKVQSEQQQSQANGENEG